MASPLTDAEIQQHLSDLPGWTVENNVIQKTFTVESYIAGAAFASTIATLCEGFNHHPDTLCIGWKKVTVSFTTHDAGNVLTANDVRVAKAVEGVRLKQPK